MGRSALPRLLTPPQPGPPTRHLPLPAAAAAGGPRPPRPASTSVRSARRDCRPARPRCCVSLSAGAAACTAWKVTWRRDRPAPPTPELFSEPDRTTPATHLHEEQHVCLLSARSFTLPRLPTGSQARAPIGRIRTLALSLHPAVDPAPPPPSAAAP